MTEAKAELLARRAEAPDRSGGDSAPEVAAERRRIGRQLHQTILQELTIAGLRLKGMQDAAPEPVAGAIGDFAGWLRDRQAELRRIVADLEQGRGGDGVTDLAAIAADLRDRYGCEMAFDPRLRAGLFSPEIWSAMIETIQGVAEVLAGDLAARRIDLRPAEAVSPTLEISHDGRRLADQANRLAAVRRLVGRNGASLQLNGESSERLILDWTS